MKPQPKIDARTQVARILDAALKLAEAAHYTKVSRDAIAKECGFASSSLVQYHCGSMEDLRRDIMRAAIRTKCLTVLAQGLAARDKHARKAPAELQQQALESLTA